MSQSRPNSPVPTAATALRYYGRSLITLLRGVRSWGAVLGLLTGRPQIIVLRDGTRFLVRTLMDLWIIKETCLDRDYETFGTPLTDGWTIVDIGAGLGDFVLSVGRRLPAARLYAFEPFPPSFALLEQNMRLNQVTNVTAIPAAVAAESGMLELAAVGAAVQHTTQPVEGQTAARQAVEALGLADLLARYELAEVDFVKIDCEGGEFDMLLHTPISDLRRLRHICLEYHDLATTHHHRELVEKLETAGFAVRVQGNPVHADLGLLYAARR